MIWIRSDAWIGWPLCNHRALSDGRLFIRTTNVKRSFNSYLISLSSLEKTNGSVWTRTRHFVRTLSHSHSNIVSSSSCKVTFESFNAWLYLSSVKRCRASPVRGINLPFRYHWTDLFGRVVSTSSKRFEPTLRVNSGGSSRAKTGSVCTETEHDVSISSL